MATHYTATKSLEHEVIRKSDIDALIKALKESGTFGNTLGYSYTAHMMPRNENRKRISDKERDGAKFEDQNSPIRLSPRSHHPSSHASICRQISSPGKSS
ncbi:hypothetical protein DY000_02039657 [Brassica cretica]|uniref:Uncharacterized protein n=1 Tax=Brassica cretica TaxID=69181 RepID=A0ABQ7BG83_BRACR|nr:hypothetical protein DY000_02039657 [Brassica cretica]